MLVSLACVGRVLAQPLVTDDALRDVGLKRYWDLQLPVTDGDSVRSAWRLDDALYVATDNGVVFALDPAVGIVRWVEQVAEPNVYLFPPVHVLNPQGSGPVVFVTATSIQVRDRYNGQTILAERPSFAPSTSVVGVERLLVGGGADGFLHAFILSGGKRGFVPRWELDSGPVRAKPALYGDGSLIVATKRGLVFSMQLLDKSLNWAFRAEDSVVANPAVDAEGVYVASLDRSLYKLDRDNGAPIWRYRTNVALLDAPMPSGGVVFQSLGDEGLAAVDVDNGHELWRRKDSQTVVGRSGDRIFVFCEGPRLDALGRKDGKREGSSSLRGVNTVVSNVADDFVYMAAADGRLLCARSSDVPYLRPADTRQARQQLNRPSVGAVEAPVIADVEKPEQAAPTEDPFRSRRDR